MSQTGRADIIRGAPYFPVGDVSAIGAYYRDVLGFDCEVLCRQPSRVCRLQPERRSSHVPPRAAAGPDIPERAAGRHLGRVLLGRDVEALHEELERKGATVVYQPVVQPYGMKEFAVRDPNGYVLGFGQTWPSSAHKDAP